MRSGLEWKEKEIRERKGDKGKKSIFGDPMADPINNFSERYQQFSDRKLLQIIQEEKDYLPEAIVAARAELESRQLTEGEIAALTDEVATIASRKINWDWMNSRLVSRFKGWLGKVEENRQLGALSALGLSFWILFRGYRNADFPYLINILWDTGYKLSWFEAYMYLPYLILLAAVPLLMLRKKVGWILSTILASTFTLFMLWDAVLSIKGLLFFSRLDFYIPLSSILLTLYMTMIALFAAAGIPILLHLRRVRALYRIEPYWVILANWVALTWVVFFIWWFGWL